MEQSTEIKLKPIGRIHSPFVRSSGTPIQSSLSRGVEGTIEIYPEYRDGLKDLDGFERIWLLFSFDRASEPQLLVHPYLDRNSLRGVFATRAPARPNGIGMSAVRLLRVESDRLHIAELDMLDGTPLLDIKPYLPNCDHFDVSRIGWYKNCSITEITADDRFEAVPEKKL